jgi:hypothetical protein
VVSWQQESRLVPPDRPSVAGGGVGHGGAGCWRALKGTAITKVASASPWIGDSDERLVPDLPRGTGRSIGGDLDVGEEGSEQSSETKQSLHHSSVDYQHAHT